MQFEDRAGKKYPLVYSGYWRMVDECLQLNVSTGREILPAMPAASSSCSTRRLPAYLAEPEMTACRLLTVRMRPGSAETDPLLCDHLRKGQ